ncbi:BEM_HP_G0103890.mRNA.1.CDS.1 [Saccharomyces cerevisiae]|nr:BEM_HP_G0103890.mRNA.1.CDS.1 [Saccharomyces cerevisiae]CAI7009030.1 BEM_HP_G0103890.mRNA.1.CDS.1 [Saccharomyces cerevisiae]
MTMPHRYMFLAVFTLLALINVASGATEACLPAGQRKSGMNINFYQYSLKDSSTYSNAAYMAYQYADKVKLGSVSGQTDISINYNLPCVTTSGTYQCPQEDAYGNWGCRGKGRCSNSQAVSYWSTDLFGFYTTPTNITLEMSGYFLPPQTGSYTFSFATVDDSAILSVGGSIAFECCAQEQPPITSTNFTINGIKPWHGSLPDNIAGTVYMYAGFYYPMKIVYSNAVSWGTLPISVTLPDGTTVSDDFEGYVYTFDNNLSQPNCTIPDPSNYTVSTTITTTEPWTGTFTSTSTEMTTVTGTNGLPTDETVIVVKTPTTAISSSLSSSSGQITSSITSSRPIITPFYPSNGTSVISSSVISSSVTSSLVTSSLVTSSVISSSVISSSAISSSVISSSVISSSDTSSVISSSVTSSLVTSSLVTSLVTSSVTSSSVISSSVISSSVISSSVISSSVISSSVISSSTTTSTSIFSESSKSSVIPTSSSTSGSSESETSSASSVSSSSSISSESPKSTYSSSSLPPVTSATTSQETASSLPPVTSATTSQETASSLPPVTTTKTSEQTTLVTVTSCESHVCTESISSAIVSTATVTVSGVTTEYTTWCPISTTEITKQTTETTKQTKGTTEQTTETTKQTTVVTISSCESDICSKTASPAIVSTSTATINDVTTEYTTWCPISTTESKQQTTLVTVTSCESGVCSETTSPAIVSTATATVNDVVTVYPTWRPQTTNEQSVSSKMNSATSETTTNTGAAETKTAVTSSLSRFNHAETQTASATDVIGHSSSVVSVSETGNTKGLITSELSTMSQQPRSTPASSMVGSSTASLEISTYVGIANGLLTNNGISVFISTVLLAIVW